MQWSQFIKFMNAFISKIREQIDLNWLDYGSGLFSRWLMSTVEFLNREGETDLVHVIVFTRDIYFITYRQTPS